VSVDPGWRDAHSAGESLFADHLQYALNDDLAKPVGECVDEARIERRRLSGGTICGHVVKPQIGSNRGNEMRARGLLRPVSCGCAAAEIATVFETGAFNRCATSPVGGEASGKPVVAAKVL